MEIIYMIQRRIKGRDRGWRVESVSYREEMKSYGQQWSTFSNKNRLK